MVKNIQCYLLLTGQVGIRGTGQRDVWDVAGRIQSHLQGWLYLFRSVSRKIPQFPLRFVFKVHRFPVNVQVHKYVVSVDSFVTLTLGFHQAPFLDSIIRVILEKGVEKVA